MRVVCLNFSGRYGLNSDKINSTRFVGSVRADFGWNNLTLVFMVQSKERGKSGYVSSEQQGAVCFAVAYNWRRFSFFGDIQYLDGKYGDYTKLSVSNEIYRYYRYQGSRLDDPSVRLGVTYNLDFGRPAQTEESSLTIGADEEATSL